MEALVTLKLKVSELDVLRRALGFYADEMHDHALSTEKEFGPKERHEARAQSVLANDLLGKLNS